MGVKDHLEDGTGHILSLGLDLDYLHVAGAERQAGLSTVTGAGGLEVKAGASSTSSASLGCSSTSSSFSSSSSTSSSFSSSSSCNNFSDNDDERLHNGSGSESQNPHEASLQHQESSSVLQTVRLDLAPSRSPGDPPQPDPLTDYRSKVEFALKLGYPEALMPLVLVKLGPDALINDVLGELVKLGTKTEMEQQGGPAVSQSPSSSLASSFSSFSSSSSSSSSSLDSCRLLCPAQLLEDKDNLRPVVLDGSNVAMR